MSIWSKRDNKRKHVNTVDYMLSVLHNSYSKPHGSEEYLDEVEARKKAAADAQRREEEAQRRKGQAARRDLGYGKK